jgi:hypothetical protein
MAMSRTAYAAIVKYITEKKGLTLADSNDQVALFTVEGFDGMNVGFIIENNENMGCEAGFMVVILPAKSPLETNVSINTCYNHYDSAYYRYKAKFVVPCPRNFETDGIKHANSSELRSLIDTTIAEWPPLLKGLHECADFSHELNFTVPGQTAGSRRMACTLQVESNENCVFGLLKSTRKLVISSAGQSDGNVMLAIPVDDSRGGTRLTNTKIIPTTSFVSEMQKFLKNGELKSSCYDNLEHFVDRLVRLCE